MDSRKRKLPSLGLDRRVRARAEPEPELDDFEDEAGSSAPSEEDVDEDQIGSESGSVSEIDSEEPDDHDGPSSEEEEEEDVSVDASKVSFGALAKAQAMLPQSGRRNKKAAQAKDNSDGEDNNLSSKPKDVPSKRDKPPARSSKHAPMEMTSKRQVSRKREIIPVKKLEARDPRFDPLITSRSSSYSNSRADEDRARKAYAFLDEYRDDEMRQLKTAVKKAKNPGEKEKLQRTLMSMESRKKARDRKDKERAVVEEHRRREKELVKEGKKAKPFYLKKSEQKKQLLVNQFTGMSEKQREKAIEKKRKKHTAST
ncbi:hypothetical protein M406DRAFT_65492 [Cryphonectria parasitica EP155]|uniref:rRNA biogenesis protein RRP36 n=1 Tax=Cryphonectria parasitica (strain ATCC 38755 / EP155) TaxID=660469 RepID=A0A9P4XSL4_CRYP1|nr:uncharacterized protein M406DRAFT_65492 [Cryphonectria parasitica EP155]KAF3760198.1 hypothetical protein M406DRAFT_65492 [Cryphonectria parasitica EP155]